MDPLTNLYLAKVYRQQKDLKRAFSIAEWANQIAEPGSSSANEIQDFLDGLMSNFAPVEFHSGGERNRSSSSRRNKDSSTRKRPASSSRQRPESRTARSRCRRRNIAFGNYTANGIAFVSGRQVSTTIVDIPHRTHAVAVDRGQRAHLWWYVGAGAALTAAGVGAWLYLREGETPPPITPYELEILN